MRIRHIPTKHVVMFSGGRTSWAAAKRVAEIYGTEHLQLLFADTNSEDEDLYRFVREAAANVGGELVWLDNGGRTIWDAMRERQFLGNTRVDPCSDELKRKPLRRWLEEHCDPKHTVVYLGMDWQETHRITRAVKHWVPWRVAYPMNREPLLTSNQVSDWLRAEGIEPPRMYAEGFLHNNCKGGCIKAGQTQFKMLLEQRPEVYAEWEREEQKMREYLEKDVAILRDRTGGTTTPLTLVQLRRRVQGDPEDYDHDDVGSCSCFAPAEG